MVSTPASPTPRPASHSPDQSPGVAGWRVILRIAGALFALAIFSYWAAAGANTGWTKDRSEITKTDEVTGIEYKEYKEHYAPGITFLIPGIGFGVAVIAATFFSRKKTTHTS